MLPHAPMFALIFCSCEKGKQTPTATSTEPSKVIKAKGKAKSEGKTKSKGKGQQTKDSDKSKPDDQPTEIVLPVTLVTRERNATRRAETYMLMNTSKNPYVATISDAKSPEHRMQMEILKGLVETKDITTVEDARLWADGVW